MFAFQKQYTIKVILFYLFLGLLIFACCLSYDSIDPDFWSRLVMGKHVVQTGLPLKDDVLSYTPTLPWIDHEWLSSAILYLIADKFGLIGVTIAKFFISFLFFVVLDLTLAIKEKKFFYRYKFLFLSTFVILANNLSFFSYLRCEKFSHLFLLIFICLLEILRKNKDSKIIYAFPILFLFWVNMHGSSIIVFPVLFFYIIGQFCKNAHVNKFFLIIVFAIIIHFINPWGFELLKFLYSAIFFDRTYIQEWLSVYKLGKTIFATYIACTFLVFACYLYKMIKYRISLIDIDYKKSLLYLFFFVSGLFSFKYAPLFLIVSSFYSYDDIRVALDDVLVHFKDNKIFSFILNLILMLSILIFSFNKIQFSNIAEKCYNGTLGTLPIKALQFIKNNSLQGNIYAIFNYSGFIAYKFYPDLKIYSDGRQEQVYSKKIIYSGVDLILNGNLYVFEEIVNEGTDIILVDNDSYGFTLLDQYQDLYKLVYKDDIHSVFLHPNLLKEEYIYNNDITDFSMDSLFDTNIDFSDKKRPAR